VDVLGQRTVNDDVYRYFELRDQLLACIQQPDRVFTDQEIRAWRQHYDARKAASTSAASGSVQEDSSAQTVDQRTGPVHSELAQTASEEVLVQWSSSCVVANVLHATESILLLQGTFGPGARPVVGTPLTIRLPDQQKALEGRLAGFGQKQSYLVALGTRGIRQAPRYKVNLPAIAHGGVVPQPVRVELVDVSRSGARVRGLALQAADELKLTFYPPGDPKPVHMRAVVTHVAGSEPPEIGVAFCMATLELDERALRSQEEHTIAA
jgi:hypothetical protein